MDSLINDSRPPVFCPGCTHERVVHGLDKAFDLLGLPANRIALVSDIGCSGLFDTFFNTHAMHGLHGRALTYATGLKMARPELTVVVTMGDGGLGIGGAHLLAACRRNLDLTLLVLNNFNFGMTGGQCSVTTPPEAQAGSSFLNRLEKPMDLCRLVEAAGAPYAARCSGLSKGLAENIRAAIAFEGFSVLDIWGICPGRYTRKNRLTPKMIDENLADMPGGQGVIAENRRPEYGRSYARQQAELPPTRPPLEITPEFTPLSGKRQELVILGSAGQRIITAGEIVGLAAMTAGLRVTQKNEYNITVLRGPSISEVIVSDEAIGYTGIETPDVVLALAQEGVDRRRAAFAHFGENTLVLAAADVMLPESPARVHTIDFKALGVRPPDRALAAVAAVAARERIISPPMLDRALEHRFAGKVLGSARATVEKGLTEGRKDAKP